MVSDSEINRGSLWWAEMPEPRRSEPVYLRPVLVIQSEQFNQSKLHTVIVAGLTSNLRLANAPGNVMIAKSLSGLAKNSIVNVSQVLALDKSFLRDRIGVVPNRLMRAVDDGLRLILGLG